VRPRSPQTSFPRGAAARLAGGDGGLDLLQGTPGLGRSKKISDLQAIGITRGRLNTKIHTVCDASGNPRLLLLTPGQRHDSKAVPELLDALEAKALLANKPTTQKKLFKMPKRKA
jgi:hypothetical protein